ncbi:MAG: hypothetical protein WAS21_21270 [Geminicoccaceae bacterium]
MAYLTVTTQADVVDPGDGQLSLREAIAQANATAGADYIKFVVTLEGQTLVLTGGELAVTQDLTIDGDRDHDGNVVTIDGNHTSRLLNISGASTDVALKGLTLTNGQIAKADSDDGAYGGAILSAGSSLVVSDVTISDSKIVGYFGTLCGGAIFVDHGSQLSIIGSNIIGNYAGTYGGGIGALSNASIKIQGSRLTGNFTSDYGRGGAILLLNQSSLTIDNSIISDNGTGLYGRGGGIALNRSASNIYKTTLSGNEAYTGGGIYSGESNTDINNSTIANNKTKPSIGYGGFGGGVAVRGKGTFSLANSTVTGNVAGIGYSDGMGGGIALSAGGGLSSTVSIINNILAGNSATRGPTGGPDIFGVITSSNGHNIFGTDILGDMSGDRELVAPATVFAAIDPATGGGQLSPTGIVPLKNAITNPALSAADPITASSFGQLGTTLRPLPTGSLPDIGSIEIKQSLSTSPTVNNDVLTGSNAANNLSGLAGNDLIQGLAGADTLNGNDGSDVLDGGLGNDKLNGGTGMDIATFAGSTAVVVDLAATPATAKRGGETDTLTSIEGVIGSTKADTFKGDVQNNEFQGGLGKDTATGGGGRDLYDFNAVADSPAGATRDVIKDFVPGQDIVDLAGIDADGAIAGNQSFRWVGPATLTGAAQLGYYISGGNTIVRASTDADAAAEVEIQLTGVKALTAADFRP